VKDQFLILPTGDVYARPISVFLSYPGTNYPQVSHYNLHIACFLINLFPLITPFLGFPEFSNFGCIPTRDSHSFFPFLFFTYPALRGVDCLITLWKDGKSLYRLGSPNHLVVLPIHHTFARDLPHKAFSSPPGKILPLSLPSLKFIYAKAGRFLSLTPPGHWKPPNPREPPFQLTPQPDF